MFILVFLMNFSLSTSREREPISKVSLKYILFPISLGFQIKKVYFSVSYELFFFTSHLVYLEAQVNSGAQSQPRRMEPVVIVQFLFRYTNKNENRSS